MNGMILDLFAGPGGWDCGARTLGLDPIGIELDRQPVPPEPTHAREPVEGLFGGRERWVSMADALGWADARVGFPRKDDLGTSPDGYRERDWRDTSEPAFTLTEKGRSWVLDRRAGYVDGVPTAATVDVGVLPAPTLTSTAIGKGVWTVAPIDRVNDQTGTPINDGIKLTIRDGLILQSFPEDWPVQGTKTSQWRQIGNACPPRLAAAVLGQVAA